MDTSENNTPAPDGSAFTKTQWIVVMAARDGDATIARQAHQHLRSIYWSPIYAYFRRHGRCHAEAENLTQGFFAWLLARNVLAMASPDRGRFRCFLLGALKHFLANESRKQTDQDGPPVDPTDPVTPRDAL